MPDRLTLAVGVGALAAGVWIGVQWTEGQHARELVAVQDAAQAREKALIRQVQEVAENAEIERERLAASLVGANGAVDGLRRTVAELNGRDSGPACQSDATRARTLLAECAAKYRDVASEADRLRAVVIGLQEYARTVSGAQDE